MINQADRLAKMVAEYRGRDDARGSRFTPFFNEDGDVIEDRYPEYDEIRLDAAVEAESDLHALLSEIEGLTAAAQPPDKTTP